MKYTGHALHNKKTNQIATALTGNWEAKRKTGRPAASIITYLKPITVMTLGALWYILLRTEANGVKWLRDVSLYAAADTDDAEK